MTDIKYDFEYDFTEEYKEYDETDIDIDRFVKIGDRWCFMVAQLDRDDGDSSDEDYEDVQHKLKIVLRDSLKKHIKTLKIPIESRNVKVAFCKYCEGGVTATHIDGHFEPDELHQRHFDELEGMTCPACKEPFDRCVSYTSCGHLIHPLCFDRLRKLKSTKEEIKEPVRVCPECKNLCTAEQYRHEW